MTHPDLITTSVWDEPGNVETLTRLWSDGASAAEVASAMGQGLTRNAVIAKVHRLKLPKRSKDAIRLQSRSAMGRVNPGQPKANGIAARAEKRQRSAALAIAQHARNTPFREGALPPEDAGVDVTSLIGFDDRRIGKDCAWIPGDPLNGAMCCGQPVKPGSEWCPEHHARVYSGGSGQYD